jgi:hypothetical protein
MFFIFLLRLGAVAHAYIPATQNLKIWRITVPGQLQQKVSETPLQQIKIDIVQHICNPSYMGDVGKRIPV